MAAIFNTLKAVNNPLSRHKYFYLMIGILFWNQTPQIKLKCCPLREPSAVILLKQRHSRYNLQHSVCRPTILHVTMQPCAIFTRKPPRDCVLLENVDSVNQPSRTGPALNILQQRHTAV